MHLEVTELVVAGVLAVVVALIVVGQRFAVPYPVVLVVAGAVLGFVPVLPDVSVDPDVVLLVFLPPLLYRQAIFANVGDLTRSTRVLVLNTVVLVLVTTAVVGALAHAVVPDLPWAAALALGAVVSPTDPLAAATVLRRLGAPRRLLSTIEGEGLFNDATALVTYQVAVTAVVLGTFSLGQAGLRLLVAVAVGVGVGLVVGWVAARLRALVADPQVSIAASLLTGYVAYLPAEALNASGILAAVTAGLYTGLRLPHVLPAEQSLRGRFVWDLVDFAINATLFALIGLELHDVVSELTAYSTLELLGYAAVVVAAVVGTRVAWLFTTPYVIRALDRRPQQRARRSPASWRIVSAWSGMRGAVSLAVALALPTTLDDGRDFPQRDLLVFLAFAVIFFTLLVQGLTLPVLVRRLGVSETEAERGEEARARVAASRAAQERLDELADEDWVREDTLERMRGLYGFRERRWQRRTPGAAGEGDDEAQDDVEARSADYQRLVRETLRAQREVLLELRRSDEISTDTMLLVMVDLDLEELRLDT